MDAGYCGRRPLTARGRPVLCLAMGVVVLASCGCDEDVVPDPWGVTPAVLVEPEIAAVPQFRVTGEGFTPLAMVLISPDGVTWTPCFTTFLSTMALDFQPAVLPAGTYSVKIDNGTGEEWTLTDAFTALPRPRITSVAPDFGPAAGGTLVTVTGEHFDDTCVVLFGFTNLEPLDWPTVVDAQTIAGRTPPWLLAIPDGNVAGTPTLSAITQTFTVQLTDGSTTLTKDYTIDIVTLRVMPTGLPVAVVGESYNQVLTAEGGLSPYTWSVGAGLPSGLTLDASGVLSGTPAANGTFNFTVTAADSDTPALTQDRAYSLDVMPAGLHLIPEDLVVRYVLPDAVGFSSYEFLLEALGGVPPYAFAVTAGILPPWLTLDASTGCLFGNAPAGGAVHDFTVTVTDSTPVSPLTASQQYRLNLFGGGGLRITTESLPAAIIGRAYEEQIGSAGGDRANLTCTIIAGQLPDGLHLNARLVPYWVEGTVAGTVCTEGPWVGFAYTAP